MPEAFLIDIRVKALSSGGGVGGEAQAHPSRRERNHMSNETTKASRDWREVLHRLDEVRWELPMDYMEGMRVPGLIFADDTLMETMASDQAVHQVANVATLPG